MITGMLAEILGADGLIVIAVVVIVLLFGGTRLPKLARGLGSALTSSRRAWRKATPTRVTRQLPQATSTQTESLLGSAFDHGA